MSMQRFETMTGIAIPKANGLIIASAGKCASIRAESDGSHPISVILQYPETMTGIAIPKPDGVVIAATCKQTPITTESERPYAISMPVTDKAEYATECVIDPNLASGRSCSKQMSLWAARNCEDIAEGVRED
jgi:hypothetical protein